MSTKEYEDDDDENDDGYNNNDVYADEVGNGWAEAKPTAAPEVKAKQKLTKASCICI